MSERHESGHSPDALSEAISTSWGGRAASSLAAIGSRAWRSSRARGIGMPIGAEWSSLSRAQRIRAAAIAVAVAMVVERSMTWLQLRPTDPLSSVLPLTVLVTSVVVAALAEPVAQLVERLGR